MQVAPIVGVATSGEHVAERDPEAHGLLTIVYGVENLLFVRFSDKGTAEMTGEVRRYDCARARTLRF